MVAKRTGNSKGFTPSHAKIPHADMEWALEQSPTVLRLWVEAWKADSFGSAPARKNTQWRGLKTKLQGSNLRAAMKALIVAQLFEFKPIQEKTSNGQWKTLGWQCLNLHGYHSGFWEAAADTQKVVADTDELADETDKVVADTDELEAEIVDTQGLENSQLITDHSSTTPQSLTKVIEEESVDLAATTQPPFEGVSAVAVVGEVKETAGDVASEFEQNVSDRVGVRDPVSENVPPCDPRASWLAVGARLKSKNLNTVPQPARYPMTQFCR